MDRHFSRVKKFLAKIVKKLNIAATNIHVGLLQFGDRYDTKITFKLGQYRFENDIRAAIKRARQSWRRSWATDIGYALKMVNKQVRCHYKQYNEERKWR